MLSGLDFLSLCNFTYCEKPEIEESIAQIALSILLYSVKNANSSLGSRRIKILHAENK